MSQASTLSRPLLWVALFALLALTTVGCEHGLHDTDSVELSEASGTQNLALSKAEVPAKGTDDPDGDESPCDEVTEAKRKLIAANSNWRFGSVDTDHPQYCELIELIYDMLIDYLETDVEMVDEEITFEIKNETFILNGVSYAAYTQPNGSAHTITFYNPNA